MSDSEKQINAIEESGLGVSLIYYTEYLKGEGVSSDQKVYYDAFFASYVAGKIIHKHDLEEEDGPYIDDFKGIVARLIEVSAMVIESMAKDLAADFNTSKETLEKAKQAENNAELLKEFDAGMDKVEARTVALKSMEKYLKDLTDSFAKYEEMVSN